MYSEAVYILMKCNLVQYIVKLLGIQAFFFSFLTYLVLYYITDGIITGGSSLKHVNDNLDAFNDGPLDPSK